MVGDVPGSAVDLARRIAELEAENRRLRQLLGVDGHVSGATTWEPTLFTKPAESTRLIGRKSTPQEKVALFPRPVPGTQRRVRTAVAQHPDRQNWLVAGGQGWMGERPPTRQGVRAACRRGDFRPSGRTVPRRLVPAAPRRFVPVVGLRFRRSRLDTRRLGLPGRGSRRGCPCRFGAIPIRRGWPCLVFFADSVLASAARRVGVFLVREAMTVRAELDLSSYDRLFPSRISFPAKGSATSSLSLCRESAGERARPYFSTP